MTPTENAQIAYAILDEANGSIANGVPTEFVALDIAKAQVYATLATVTAPPTAEDLQGAFLDVLSEHGDLSYGDMAKHAAEAVLRLL